MFDSKLKNWWNVLFQLISVKWKFDQMQRAELFETQEKNIEKPIDTKIEDIKSRKSVHLSCFPSLIDLDSGRGCFPSLIDLDSGRGVTQLFLWVLIQQTI